MQFNLKKVTQSFVVVASVGLMAWLAPARPARRTPKVTARRADRCRRQRGGMAHLWPRLRRNPLQPADQINTKNVNRLSLAWSSLTLPHKVLSKPRP